MLTDMASVLLDVSTMEDRIEQLALREMGLQANFLAGLNKSAEIRVFKLCSFDGRRRQHGLEHRICIHGVCFVRACVSWGRVFHEGVCFMGACVS